MDKLETLKEIAAQWVAQREGGAWSAGDEAELERWLEADTGHRIAYLRMLHLWQHADRLKMLGAGAKGSATPHLPDLQDSPYFKHAAPQANPAPILPPPLSHRAARRALPWVSAAAIVVGLGLYAWSHDFFRGEVYSTPVGVTAAVPMTDGSMITLNTNSQVRVEVSEAERRVNLDRGEAFFEVAHDVRRPFIVHAGDKLVTAVGTNFSVSRDSHDAVRVVVSEGKVRVDEVRSLHPHSAQVSAGSVALAGSGSIAVEERSMPQVAELLSWRAGFIVFHETTLAEAVAEFNRYNTTQVELQDPALAQLRISGNFRATNIDSFTQLLEGGYLVSVERQDGRIVLSRR